MNRCPFAPCLVVIPGLVDAIPLRSFICSTSDSLPIPAYLLVLAQRLTLVHLLLSMLDLTVRVLPSQDILSLRVRLRNRRQLTIVVNLEAAREGEI